ncbi:hypothetical protein M409DRAFT_30202 [Zasmidium cellare ATCC 36951]|uniref:Uncharacterized protein n=1 Tax=Zasmidium cellare ATCC 36951 TaxID=1080233 RepID=A0A6A6C0U4_ZASCE|nr:uncharacterized protein M409DRAFT_30202 [Zasmidium cellare ATCC 36951]KAF2159326.1 hypothetical protein M409DRAFT_30202 [Zasmidium cellare ATCC 36951]
MSSSAPATWACAQCSSTFDKSKLLERHALQTSHKAYKCSKCPKTFGKRTALIRHNTTHSDVKSHACRVCGKAFHRKDHCAEHEEVCTHRLAVETRERLSASLAGRASTSNDNVIATSENTSPTLPPGQTISHATDSRKRYREVDGDGDRSGSSSETPAVDLRHTPRPELQELRTSEPDQASRHNEADILENAGQNVSHTEGPLPEALLQPYPALRDIDSRATPIYVPPVHGNFPNFSFYTCPYHGCTHIFSSPANVEIHEREYHRATVANTRESETDDDYLRSSQVDMDSQTRRTSRLPLLEFVPPNIFARNNGLYSCAYHGCAQRFSSHEDYQRHYREHHDPHNNAPPSSQTMDSQGAVTDSAADFPAHLVPMETSLREQLPVKTNLFAIKETMWTRRPRIFVVEEREGVVSWILSGFDCSVNTGFFAREIVLYLGSGTIDPHDLIFIDASVGILRWAEAINVIRQIEQTKSIPIILMTPNIRSDAISSYFKHGASDVLPKPFEREDVFRMLEKHLAHLIKED